MAEIQPRHNSEITHIVKKVFGVEPEQVSRLGNGICNEVYLVKADGTDAVVRLNMQPRFLRGSRDHIPIFRELGIRVPEIIAEDYSKTEMPFAWHILSRIEGRDLGDVIHTLDDDQLRLVAGDIANVFLRLREVPNNGRYGVQWGDDDELTDSWATSVQAFTDVVIRWGTKTGVLDAEMNEILRSINADYKSYFDSVRAVTYYGDICAKNVMIHEGRFAGIVDLDALAQGDPLEAVGRIKASWHGTHHGTVYTNAVMNELALDDRQRRIVAMYALLNRTFWTMENGVQFNQNTSAVVDREKEARDKSIVRSLWADLDKVQTHTHK